MIKHMMIIVVAQMTFAQSQADEGHIQHHGHDETEELMFTGMPSINSLSIPMSMDGSGTSWLPGKSSSQMKMTHSNNWMLMYHGNVFFRYTQQGGKRGASQISAPNWYMLSAQYLLSPDQQVTFRSMVSADRFTEGGNGYPLLLQSGESWKGQPLVDRQHPHDLFAELSATYAYSLDHRTSAYLYLGYPGEPALGPPAFMHRPSSQYNPDAPIGHHWQDATHITFGVGTVGFVIDKLKLESSIFTGREPDENRINFEKPLFDSYSGRLSYNPGNNFALQASFGQLHDPEGHGDDVQRISASVLYSESLENNDAVHASLIWGQNNEHHTLFNSVVFEILYQSGAYGWYGRHETVEKPRYELGVDIEKSRRESVRQYSAGLNYLLMEDDDYSLHAGIQSTVSVVSQFMEHYYGKNPVSWQIYVQFR